MQQRPVMRWIERCANPRQGGGNDRRVDELRGDRCSQSLPGMSEGRAAYDRQRHDTGGPPPSRHECRRPPGPLQTPTLRSLGNPAGRRRSRHAGSAAISPARSDRRRRTKCSNPVSASAAPASWLLPSTTQDNSASALMATTIMSNRPNGAGRRPGFSRTSPSNLDPDTRICAVDLSARRISQYQLHSRNHLHPGGASFGMQIVINSSDESLLFPLCGPKPRRPSVITIRVPSGVRSRSDDPCRQW
jgi:hypothetical protein